MRRIAGGGRGRLAGVEGGRAMREVFVEVASIEGLSRFERALVVAARVHKDQIRKGSKVPYISHLVAVASLVRAAGGDDETTVAALLHDSIEDQGVDAADIEEFFGSRVRSIVEGCTDVIDPTEERGNADTWARKQRYLEHLRVEESRDVLRVALADKLHNARETLTDYELFGDEVWERFNVGKDGQLRYYGGLSKAFAGKMKGDRQLDEFSAVVSRLTELSGDDRSSRRS